MCLLVSFPRQQREIFPLLRYNGAVLWPAATKCRLVVIRRPSRLTQRAVFRTPPAVCHVLWAPATIILLPQALDAYAMYTPGRS